jgi:hypothetical protein
MLTPKRGGSKFEIGPLKVAAVGICVSRNNYFRRLNLSDLNA